MAASPTLIAVLLLSTICAGNVVPLQAARPEPTPMPAMDGEIHGETHGENHVEEEMKSEATAEDTVGRLKKFVDPLPIPTVIDASEAAKNDDGVPTINMGAFVTTQQFHRDLPPTKVYAFGTSQETAAVPGPTIRAYVGSPLRVRWMNNISDDRHMLPVDETLMVPKLKKGGVPITIHVHGAQVASRYDGHPDAWWTPRGEYGPAYETNEADYPNVQPSSTLWYHDHTVGMTRLNMLAGLLGVYVLKDPEVEAKFQLPGEDDPRFDVPLVIADHAFMKNGDIFMSSQGVTAVHPQWIPEYFGNFMTVNGKVTPYLNVERRKYRFRLVNAANARFLELNLRATPPVARSDSLSPKEVLQASNNTSYPFFFTQVANDGGYLNKPLLMRRLTIAPGERACIVIDFSELPIGATVRMKNRAPAPYPDGDDVPLGDLRYVMQFNVVEEASSEDTSMVPARLNSVGKVDLSKVDVTREITLTEMEDKATGEPAGALLEGKHFMEEADIKPKWGTTELWQFINLSEDTHPIHVHFLPHRVVYRRPINTTLYMQEGGCSLSMDGDTSSSNGDGKSSCYTGDALRPFRNERGYKDTTRAPPGYVTAMVLAFEPWLGKELPFDPKEAPGYVIHCHILDHEDNDMMRPFEITE